MEELISKLKEKGVIFKTGLNGEQINKLENELSGVLPADLRQFLSCGVPVGYLRQTTLTFPDWHKDIGEILSNSQRTIDKFFEMDIDDGYWSPMFGEKPATTAEAKDRALRIIHTLPTLIPVYGHRFMMAIPGSPVISFQGIMDTIIYGNNLEDYFIKEFALDLQGSNDTPVVDADWGKLLQI